MGDFATFAGERKAIEELKLNYKGEKINIDLRNCDFLHFSVHANSQKVPNLIPLLLTLEINRICDNFVMNIL